MGANCCVAAKDKLPPDSALLEVSTYRNVRHSPPWNFRCDNRTHIEDIISNPVQASYNNNYNNSSGNASSGIKSGMTTEIDGLFNMASPSNDLQTQKWHKSMVKTETFAMQKADLTGQSIESNASPEATKSAYSAGVAVLSSLSSSSLRADPSSSRSRSLPSDLTSSRKACRSPGYQLSRQISDSIIPSLRSLHESSSPEGRQSCMLSVCSTDFSGGGSHDGSSDGWSMRTFSELVASSQRECWYLDNENFLYDNSRSAKVDSQQLIPESPDQQDCRICTKLLKEKSPWTELSVVAILVCGHVYHAECLENVTHGSDSYDPPCPICTHGEKPVAKFGKVERARNKISQIAVADIDTDQDAFSDQQKRTREMPRTEASSSMKSSFGRPFLKRHLSIGIGQPSRLQAEKESSRKKSFWARYWRA